MKRARPRTSAGGGAPIVVLENSSGGCARDGATVALADLAPQDSLTAAVAKGIAALALILAVLCASAVETQADFTALDGAAERLGRKLAAKEGRLTLPLPGTPDTATLDYRLAIARLKLGSPILIRIFKAEFELEIWIEKDGTYVPFASYPICYWSGTLGPKLREGDRQAPDGFYTITIYQLHDGRRWTRSLDIGFPNALDQANERSGSNILVHGGCDSVGCFAMTDRVNAEIYDLVSAALSAGVVWVPVHVFPFKMTDENFAARAADKWSGFWITLKQGYDSFERTRLPPRVSVCDKAYSIEDAVPGAGREAGPVAFCGSPSRAASHVVATQPSQQAAHAADAIPTILLSASTVRVVDRPNKNRIEASIASAVPKTRAASRSCSASRPSCRRWLALRENRMTIGQAKLKHANANVRTRNRTTFR